ncbi:hypothetical protein QBC42DRAFT_290931 [Cladorrhinum samala]|uniref:Uncharacterized protein n=1 Tax=Cladorrhinum samala TaxID=585594 RepID=A0AAV9HF76_9PEZI|nr:hypothetical protein QBC42DRAFT_290931 [Cladorrhinum samala]
MTYGINEISENFPSDFQNSWVNNSQSCYRPPPDLDIKFLCKISVNRTLTNGRNVITGTEGGDFELFKPCCGAGGSPAGENGEQNWGDARDRIYTLEHNCGGAVCYTKIEKEASYWGDCVRDQTENLFRRNETLRDKFGGLNATEQGRQGPSVASGWCETVWYENLEKSIAKKSSASGAGWKRKGGCSNVGMMMVLGLVAGVWVQGLI